MKLTIREGVWETNSSSVHALCICNKSDYDKWLNGEAYYDIWVDKIVTNKLEQEDEDHYLSVDDYYDYIEKYEGFEEDFISPSGDEIKVFGYSGFDY